MTQDLTRFDFKTYLSEIYENPSKLHDAYRAFHNYSLGNAMLAQMQLGKAEPINTFKGWQALGRNVKKGSKAIALLMPVTCKKTTEVNGEEQESCFTRFIARKNWFGISQTEGEELAMDSLPNFNLDKALEELGITKKDFAMVNGNCQGYAYPDRKEIAINPIAYAPFKTAIHEIAHCLLHSSEAKIVDGDSLETSEKEFEAESTAYLVCVALGKDAHLEYSRGYIGNWLKRDDAKESCFRRAFNAANQILKAGKI